MTVAAAEPVRVPFYRIEPFPTLWFLIKLAAFALLFRSVIAAPFTIPTPSMVPRLWIGDYLVVAKWPYGWSRHSFPFGLAPFSGRWAASLPARGDVVVFKAPPAATESYIKRVIGLPGDTVQLRDGQLILNGVAVARQRVSDFVTDVEPNSPCLPGVSRQDFADRLEDGTPVCRYPRYRETLPSGRYYDVLDLGRTSVDDTPVYTVPADHLFMLGDNRDQSADSRFDPADGGVGFVPIDNLEGRAILTFYSTDGSGSLARPWTWPATTRWSRIGGRHF